ncbi:MAG: tetratricopeptide repeat protein, partial [Chitinophagales bacterium]
MHRFTKIISLLFCFLAFSLKAQDLNDIIEQTKEKLSAETALEQKAILSGDLAWYYAQVSTDSAVHYGNLSLQYAKETKMPKLIGQAYNDLGTVFFTKGDYMQSIKYCKQALKIRKEEKDEEGVASVYYKLGNNFNKLGSFDSTMHYYILSLNFYENKGDTAVVANLQSNIASTYFSMGNYTKALDYLKQPLEYFESTKDWLRFSNSSMTLGNILLLNHDTIGALESYKMAEEYADSSNNLSTLAAIYNNYSNIYTNQRDFDKAIYYIQLSIALREELGMYSELESSKLTLALNQCNMGDYKEAKPRLLELQNSFEKIQAKEKLKEVYLSLSYVYAYENKADSVRYYSNKFKTILEELLHVNTLKISDEIEVKYQTEKKEKEILLQRAKLAEQRIYLLLFVALSFIIALLGYIFYKQQRIKNEQLVKENELKDAMLKIETQNRLQEQRLRISRDLHDNIGSQLTFVISSLDSMKHVFAKTSPILENKLNDLSLFTRETIAELRDTIWAMNKEEISVEDLQARISNFIENAKVHLGGVQFEFNYKTKENDNLKFSAQDGMHIYRVIQEAINNAIKHANASKIIVNFASEAEAYLVEIS